MDLRYPAAAWRPLGALTGAALGVPRLLLIHSIAGRLQPLDEALRRRHRPGPVVVERFEDAGEEPPGVAWAHFGIGGPWDGASLDGAVWQWQPIDVQADLRDGNARATAVETSDGGDPLRPWSARQLDALITLGTWWCRQTGAPARLVGAPTESGIGYHAQFDEWNPHGRICPGRTRIAQLMDVVVPGIATRLARPEPGHESAPAAGTTLTAEDLHKIAATVWSARFGHGPTTGVMLQRSVVDVEAIAKAVVAALPAERGLTRDDVEFAVRNALGGAIPGGPASPGS